MKIFLQEFFVQVTFHYDSELLPAQSERVNFILPNFYKIKRYT